MHPILPIYTLYTTTRHRYGEIAIVDSDDFRRSELYSADVDAVLRPRMVILRLIYDKFKGKRAYHEGVDEMPMSHWTTFVTKMYLVNKEFTIRKARIIFAISRLGGVDDYAQQVGAARFINTINTTVYSSILNIHIQSNVSATYLRT